MIFSIVGLTLSLPHFAQGLLTLKLQHGFLKKVVFPLLPNLCFDFAPCFLFIHQTSGSFFFLTVHYKNTETVR